DVRDDRPEPSSRLPRGEGRPRLRRAGSGAEDEYRADASHPRAHAPGPSSDRGSGGGTRSGRGRLPEQLVERRRLGESLEDPGASVAEAVAGFPAKVADAL